MCLEAARSSKLLISILPVYFHVMYAEKLEFIDLNALFLAALKNLYFFLFFSVGIYAFGFVIGFN